MRKTFNLLNSINGLLEAKPENMSNNEKSTHDYLTRNYGPSVADHFIHSGRKPSVLAKLPGDDYQTPATIPNHEALALAAHEGTPHKILTRLSDHPDKEVRNLTASNPNTHPDDLLRLAGEGHHEQVAANPALPLVFSDFERNPQSLIKALPHILNSDYINHPMNTGAKEDLEQAAKHSKIPAIRDLVNPRPELDNLFTHGQDINPESMSSDDEFANLMKKMFRHESINVMDALGSSIEYVRKLTEFTKNRQSGNI